jgi:hypothetical protein
VGDRTTYRIPSPARTPFQIVINQQFHLWKVSEKVDQPHMSYVTVRLHLSFSHGVRLSPLDTEATVWPSVPDRWWWLWSNRWNVNWQGKPKYSGKTCPRATLSTTNSTWPDPGSNPGHCSGKLVTNRLSYGIAQGHTLLKISSPGTLLYGNRWLPRHPCKYDTTLCSKSRIVEGLKQRGIHNRSLMVMVQEPVKAHPLFIIHSYQLFWDFS